MDYLEEIEPSNITDLTWGLAGKLVRAHGNGKASTGGKYHIETMRDSNGRYIAKIVGASGNIVTVAPAGSPEPSMADVVEKLKEEYS